MLVAAAATLLVGCASVISLVGYFPVRSLAKRLAPHRPGTQAAVLLAGLVFPVVAGILLVSLGLTRHLLHPLFSPHAGRLRFHLCWRPLLEGPDAPWRARLLVALCLGVTVAALACLVAGWARGLWEQKRARRLAGRLTALDWAPRVQMLEADYRGIASHRGLSRLVLVSPRLSDFFPGEQAQAVIAHEVCHALRRDGLLGPLACALLLLQGLSPTAYLVYRQWRQAREEACDAYAGAVASPSAVAKALARAQDLARSVEEVSPLSPASATQLEHLAARLRRAHALGAGRASEPTAAGRGVAVATAGALLAIVGLIWALPSMRDSVHCAVEALLQVLGH